MRSKFFRPLTLTLALAAVTGLAACDRDEGRDDIRTGDRTVGQTLDSAAATSARKAGEVAGELRQGASNAANAVSNTTKDIAITAAVKSRLAQDSQLSALAINVDTNDGRVVLRGTAPDTASRTLATELASGVDGVVAVDNSLTVQVRSN